MVNPHNPFGGRPSVRGSTTMRVGDFTCTLHTPPALEKRFDGSGQEIDQGLPPSAPRETYLVDDLPTCPKNWMRSSRDSASYLVPVREGNGLWLDFNGNARYTHDVAVQISVQKLNPVSGLKVDGQILEQYTSEVRRVFAEPHRLLTECPRHGVPFGRDRLCERCGYKWPAQNYLATTGTRQGELWLDGFRAEDGTIRQFIFTEESMRGVAAQVIGEDRVFALGVSFFLSRNPKPVQVHHYTRGGGSQLLGGGFKGGLESFDEGFASYTPKSFAMGGGQTRGVTRSVQNLEVGMGARVSQNVYPDPKDLSYWEPNPAGTIYINYAPVEQVQRILAAGKLDRTAGGEGAYAGIKVGVPDA